MSQSHVYHLAYRPKAWDEVIGHDGTIKSLRAALESGRARSFILVGPSGVGKTTLARIIALELDIDTDGSEYQELDAASRTGVDDMREIKQKLRFKPLGGGNRLICIDECHKLSSSAWDSLLKDVEEPPSGVYWVFCTTNASKIPKAVRTRCLSYDLDPLTEDEIGEVIQNVIEEEELQVEADVFQQICESADGSPRQALVLLSSIVGLTSRKDIMSMLQESSGEEGNAGDLCRFLARGGSWPAAMKIVGTMADEPAESIRHVVCGYFTKVAMGARNEADATRACAVLSAFYEPYPSGIGKQKYPLLISLGELLLGGE